MNEIQIIQTQLALEQVHFTKVAAICAAALANDNFIRGELTRACSDYFAFALTRVPVNATAPAADASPERWREFLQAFNEAIQQHFSALDALLTRNLPVAEWRARSGIDADSIFAERTLFARVQAAVP